MADFSIFYIGHIVDPFLFYCLTKNYLLPILFVVLWEIIEYVTYSITGNYSILFLETADSVMEGLDDILIYDIGGGIVAVYIAFTLYHFYKIEKSIITLDFFTGKTWGFIILFLFRSLVLSPLGAIGWECNATVSQIMASICPDNKEYNDFAWGLIGIVLINTGYIYYMFKGETKQFTIAILFCGFVMLTATQRLVSGIVITMYSLLVMVILATLYWVYYFKITMNSRQRRVDYTQIQTQP